MNARKLLPLALAANVLLSPVAPAFAATNPPLCGGSLPCYPYQSSAVAREKRIAVIQPQRWDVQSNNLKLAVIRHVTPALDAFRAQGGEVHWYKSTFFESDADHREMWTDIGARYAAVIVVEPTAITTAMTRYLCADSTNGQLIVVGGGEMGGAATWVTAPNERGTVDTSRNSAQFVSSTSGAGLVTMDGRDTLWMKRGPTGRRAGVIGTGIDRVVRLLRPMTTAGTSFVTGNADSTLFRPPGSWNTAYGADWTPGSFARALMATDADSIAGPGEMLGPLWKVRFSKYSGQDVTSWINSLATAGRGVGGGGTSPQEVYWLKVLDNPNPGDENTHLLWALMCRFTTIDPIRYAYDWDDATDINDTQYPRWRNSQAESSLAALRNFDITPTNMVNPRNAVAYLRGQKPDYEPAWSGPAHTYLKKLTWVHHAHDSTRAHPSSNLVGGFGGYQPGNDFQLSQGATNVEYRTSRLGSRFDPTSTGQPLSTNFGAGGAYGIVNRLLYSDSLRMLVSPNSLVPPYAAQPANSYLPVNWRVRPTASNPLWTLWNSAAATCPIDTVMWAFDYGLNGRQTSGVGRVTYRIIATPPWGNSTGITAGYGVSDQDRDSMVASTWFKRPGEMRTTRVGNRVVEAMAAGSFLQGIGGRTAYMDDAEGRAVTLLGLRGGSVTSERARTEWGETYSADRNNATRPATAGSPVVSIVAENFRNTTRVVYQHPGQQTAPIPGNSAMVNNSSADLHVEVFIRSIAPHIRALTTIAGRKATTCVPGWQVYSR